MSYSNFIPTYWAKTLEKGLDRECVITPNTNRKYEGLIKQAGDSVKILGIEKPTITTASDGKQPSVPTIEEVPSNAQIMTINQTGAFNFKVDDLDKAQSEPKGILDDLMGETRKELAVKMDKHVAEVACGHLGGNVTQKASTKVEIKGTSGTSESILDVVDGAKKILWQNDVPVGEKLTMFVPPWFAIMMNQAFINFNTNNPEYMKNGNVGRYGGIDFKMTNNLYNDGTDDYCFLMTDRAVAFANPFTHMEAYRVESGFCDAVKGFSLWQAKVVRPKEVYALKLHA